MDFSFFVSASSASSFPEGRKGPLLPIAAANDSSGVPCAAWLSRGRSGAHSDAVRACPDPLFGGPYMHHRISQAEGLHELPSPGRGNLRKAHGEKGLKDDRVQKGAGLEHGV